MASLIAAELRARGHDVQCILPGSSRPRTEDARAAFGRWTAAGGPTRSHKSRRNRASAPLSTRYSALAWHARYRDLLDAVAWMNQQQSVYAIDVPSGLIPDTGAWVGDVPGVSATATITFIGDKPGLHTASGIDAAGTSPSTPSAPVAGSSDGMLSTAADLRAVLARRRHDSHKGTYGNVAVVGGGRGMVGAVLLAGRAALRLGAGPCLRRCDRRTRFARRPVAARTHVPQPARSDRVAGARRRLRAWHPVRGSRGVDPCTRARDCHRARCRRPEPGCRRPGPEGACPPAVRPDHPHAPPARSCAAACVQRIGGAARSHFGGAATVAGIRCDHDPQGRRQRDRRHRTAATPSTPPARRRLQPRARATCWPGCLERCWRRESRRGTSRSPRSGCMDALPMAQATSAWWPVMSPLVRRAKCACRLRVAGAPTERPRPDAACVPASHRCVSA